PQPEPPACACRRSTAVRASTSTPPPTTATRCCGAPWTSEPRRRGATRTCRCCAPPAGCSSASRSPNPSHAWSAPPTSSSTRSASTSHLGCVTRRWRSGSSSAVAASRPGAPTTSRGWSTPTPPAGSGSCCSGSARTVRPSPPTPTSRSPTGPRRSRATAGWAPSRSPSTRRGRSCARPTGTSTASPTATPRPVTRSPEAPPHRTGGGRGLGGSALRHLAVAGPHVLRERPDERVRLELLHDVRRPAGHAGGDEQRGERRGVEAHEVVRRAGRVVEVGLDALRLLHRLLERCVELAEVGPLVVRDEIVEHRLHRRHPGVAVLVDAVPEAHDLALVGERVLEPRLRG